jgi:hypothetical protein
MSELGTEILKALAMSGNPLSSSELFARCPSAGEREPFSREIHAMVKDGALLKLGSGRGTMYAANGRIKRAEIGPSTSATTARPVVELAPEGGTHLANRFALTSDRTLIVWAGDLLIELDQELTQRLREIVTA